MKKIAILDASSLGADMDLSLFSSLGELEVWDRTSESEIDDRIRDCHIIICNRVSLNEKTLSSAQNLECIALTATGYNTVDLDYCASKGISVCNVKHYSTESVAQHCFAMLFYILEQTRYYDDYVRNEQYKDDQRFAELSRPWFELKGKRWGIIGLGAIGKRVAEIANVFGMKVMYASTSGCEREEPVERVSLNTLLSTCDIVSVHAPLNENTEGLLGQSEFGLMKKDSYFLNLGRGAIIDEAALAHSLDQGLIRAAALDVMTQEPPASDNPLLPLIGERLLITPHNAWGSLEARTLLVNEVYENIKAHFRGEQRNSVVEGSQSCKK